MNPAHTPLIIEGECPLGRVFQEDVDVMKIWLNSEEESGEGDSRKWRRHLVAFRKEERFSICR